jgi:hypothetical protein
MKKPLASIISSTRAHVHTCTRAHLAHTSTWSTLEQQLHVDPGMCALQVATTLAGALEELPYSFADLPLRDFQRKPEASQAAVFLLRRPGQQAGECLAFAGMDALVGAAPCKITDGQLWSYRSLQLVLAHDTSLCLDEFGPHAGNDLGVYWCHGEACLLLPTHRHCRTDALAMHAHTRARSRAQPRSTLAAPSQAAPTSASCGEEARRPASARQRCRKRTASSGWRRETRRAPPPTPRRCRRCPGRTGRPDRRARQTRPRPWRVARRGRRAASASSTRATCGGTARAAARAPRTAPAAAPSATRMRRAAPALHLRCRPWSRSSVGALVSAAARCRSCEQSCEWGCIAQ